MKDVSSLNYKLAFSLLTLFAMSSISSAQEIDLKYNVLTLSPKVGNPIAVPAQPDKVQCKELIIDGDIEVYAKGTSLNFGSAPGTIIFACDKVTFNKGARLSTWSHLTIRTHDLSGEVVVDGLRKRSGAAGTSHDEVAASGANGANGANGGNGRDAKFIGRDADNGGSGAAGGAGQVGSSGANAGDGSPGENNVIISVLADRIDKNTTFDIKSDGGRAGAGGNGQAGGAGGAAGVGGNGGKGGDGSCTHAPNRGGHAGNGGKGGDGGAGGDGGNGGKGGDGGNIYIAKNDNDPSLFQLKNTPALRSQGGKGGIAGQGGAGGPGGAGGAAGTPGLGGQPGNLLEQLACFKKDSPAYSGAPARAGVNGKPGPTGKNGVPGPDGKDGEIRAAIVTETKLPSFITDPLLDRAPSN